MQYEDKPAHSKHLRPATINWLKRRSERVEDKECLCFFGGEPLLYRDTIHQTIDTLGDRYRYAMVSNGSLLTDEDVDYFNEHDLQYTVSHDGACTSITRKKDMLADTEFVSRFNKIKYRSVDLVSSAFNSNLDDAFNYIYEKLGYDDIVINVEELICSPSLPTELVNWDLDALAKGFNIAVDKTIEYMNTHDEPPSVNVRGVSSVIKYLRTAKKYIDNPTEFVLPRCGSGKRMLSLDPEGNFYLCKNYNLKIGTVLDDDEKLYQASVKATDQLRKKNFCDKGCPDCSAVFFCRGACPFEQASEQQKKKCETIKLKWKIIEDRFFKGNDHGTAKIS
jgi:radical SAM protein with 4Fe4S-binding SPASM domain